MGLGITRRATPSQAGESLIGARKAARDARDRLQAGVDPIDERDQRREAAKQAEADARRETKRASLTLARVACEYHERVIEPSRSAKHAAQWIATLEQHVPRDLWLQPIADATAPVLLGPLLNLQRQVPETASRVRQRLDAVFEDAMFHGHCTSNPAAAIRRKLREAQSRKKKGEFAALPYREAPAFMARLRDIEGMAARCLEFAVLTAARTSESLLAEPPEFDLQLGLWTVPAARMKGGEDHVVYLSARAIELVKAQIQLGQRYLFPSPVKPKAPLSNMAMLTLLTRMKMREQTTVHGLCRATFSTWANETAAARPDVIEACLAHKEGDKVKAAYNRAQFAEERKTLLAAWADYLLKPVGAVVLPFAAA